jgi:hypothetical protein
VEFNLGAKLLQLRRQYVHCSSTLDSEKQTRHTLVELIELQFGVQGSGFRVQGSGFRVQGSGFGALGLGRLLSSSLSCRAMRQKCDKKEGGRKERAI